MAPRRSAEAPPPLLWQRGRCGRALMAAEGPEPGPEASLVSLYRWLDTVPLSRPRRNIARDFSDGVLAAEVVKFFFPSLVELHSFVPTSSTAQKVANWGHLNRKVLSKLNLRLPEELIQGLVRSQPGAAEQLLQLLRDKILQRQRSSKGGAGKPPAELAALDEGRYLDTGQPRLRSDLGRGCSQEGAARGVTVTVPAPTGAGLGDMRQQLAEREQALQLARDTIQILQAKVGRLEQLLLLKNLRIDDLSQRLQQLQGQRR
ncbi:sperm flagellar protein 1 [Haemorhous mexicanus]|uniref:sperm flagellar protein 1 n=1 Tax=Haemorhous mexicanus TaxID=30427 RepID=UPI0028BF0944|nr:sperm flagellar protein 1 [Haemorhous mexicanus]